MQGWWCGRELGFLWGSSLGSQSKNWSQKQKMRSKAASFIESRKWNNTINGKGRLQLRSSRAQFSSFYSEKCGLGWGWGRREPWVLCKWGWGDWQVFLTARCYKTLWTAHVPINNSLVKLYPWDPSSIYEVLSREKTSKRLLKVTGGPHWTDLQNSLEWVISPSCLFRMQGTILSISSGIFRTVWERFTTYLSQPRLYIHAVCFGPVHYQVCPSAPQKH
jgi:hypothetical protein